MSKSYKVYVDHINQDLEKDSEVDNDQSLPKQDIDESKANLRIRVHESVSVTDFVGFAWINPHYIQKLLKWNKKNKYKIGEEDGDLEISFAGIFSFTLKKVQKTHQEELKQNICRMRKENMEMLGSLKLFWHYFFTHWNERNRFDLEDCELKQELIDSTDNLYHQTTASGVVKDELSSKYFYLQLNEESEGEQEIAKLLTNLSLGDEEDPRRTN